MSAVRISTTPKQPVYSCVGYLYLPLRTRPRRIFERLSARKYCLDMPTETAGPLSVKASAQTGTSSDNNPLKFAFDPSLAFHGNTIETPHT